MHRNKEKNLNETVTFSEFCLNVALIQVCDGTKSLILDEAQFLSS